MPRTVRQGDADKVSLIDGSVLVNAPFREGDGRAAEPPGPPRGRPALRVYRPDAAPTGSTAPASRRGRRSASSRAIFGSISAIPREQPIRDNLERMAAQSREAERLAQMVTALRPDVERAVDKLFGRTLLPRPADAPSGSANWRAKAQQDGRGRAGFAYHAYAQAQVHRRGRPAGARDLSSPRRACCCPTIRTIAQRAPRGAGGAGAYHARRCRRRGERCGRSRSSASTTSVSASAACACSRGALAREWDDEPGLTDDERDRLRETLYEALALYFDREMPDRAGRRLRPESPRRCSTSRARRSISIAERRDSDRRRSRPTKCSRRPSKNARSRCAGGCCSPTSASLITTSPLCRCCATRA